MEPQVLDLAPMQVRAAFVPSTWDEEARTIEVVASTGAEVTRRHWERGRFLESLGMQPRNIRLDRLRNGASVLDDHKRWGGVRTVLGVTEDARLEAGKLYVRLRFSDREDVQGTVRDIATGIVRNVSLGYVVHKYEDRTEKNGNVKRYRAIDWEPYELSFVIIPAEVAQGTRAAGDLTPCEIVSARSASTMEEELEFGEGVGNETTTETTTTATRSQGESEREGESHSGTAPPPAAQTRATHDPAPSVDGAALERARAEAAREERARVAQIAERCSELGLPEETRSALVDGGLSGTDLQLALQDAYIRRHRAADSLGETTPGRVQVGTEGLSKRLQGAEGAILRRMMPGVELEGEQARDAQDFEHMSLVDIAAEVLVERRAIPHARALSPHDIATRAMHSTSDFPHLLESTGRRTLLAMYDEAPGTWEQWCQVNPNVVDYRQIERIRVGDAPPLDPVPEGGEYPEGTLGEAKEQYKVAKYGHIVSFTEEAMVNDDLGGLSRALQTEAIMVRELESDLVYTELLSGGTLEDGNGIFHASRNNSTDLDFDLDGLAKLRELMRLQRTKAGKGGRYLNLMPRYLLVPPELETKAEQHTRVITPNEATKVNVFERSLIPIAEARLSGGVGALSGSSTAYYGVAQPGRVDTIEVGYLRGRRAPRYETKRGFDVDGIRFKVGHVVGVKAIDYRGFAFSDGTNAA